MKPLAVWPAAQAGSLKGNRFAGRPSLRVQLVESASSSGCSALNLHMLHGLHFKLTQSHQHARAFELCSASPTPFCNLVTQPLVFDRFQGNITQMPSYLPGMLMHADCSRTGCVPPGCVAPRLLFIATVSQAAASRKLLSAV